MKARIFIAVFAVYLYQTISFADRENFAKPSPELANAIAASATSLGYDLSNEEGRKKFGDYLKSKKDSLASSLGVDPKSEDGRKKMHEAIRSHVDEIAQSQGFDMSTQEGRDSLEKYLVSKGDFAYLRPDRSNRTICSEKDSVKSVTNSDSKSQDKQPGGQQQRPAMSEGASNSQTAPSQQARTSQRH